MAEDVYVSTADGAYVGVRNPRAASLPSFRIVRCRAYDAFVIVGHPMPKLRMTPGTSSLSLILPGTMVIHFHVGIKVVSVLNIMFMVMVGPLQASAEIKAGKFGQR